MRAKAAVLYEAGQPAIIEEITLDPPRQGEVLVRMEAAGVCHSDLHVRDGSVPEPMPIVLGHEGTGVVVEVGPGVSGLQPGDRVVLTLVPAILSRIQAGRMRIDGMVSHSVPLEELESAFSRLRNGDGVRTVLRF